MSAISAALDVKSAKKRKAKTEAATASAEATSPASEQVPALGNTTAPSVNGQDSSQESPFIKELGRQIRNVHKKLSASSKADAVVAENPNKSIDDLVAEKKINADQKAQLLKKPALQNQLAQLEEQLSQYRNFAQDLEDRHAREKAGLIESHEAEIARIKEEATNTTEHTQPESLGDALKVVSHFLHAAASKRQSEDAESQEARAFEGALLLVYQGNEASLSTLMSLIEGSDDKVPDTSGELLDFTFAQIRESALREVQELAQVTEADVDEVQPNVETTESDDNVTTDPTIANAGLTELEDTTAIPIRSNGSAEQETITAIPEQASTTDEAANAVAESSWDPQASMTTDASGAGDEWVQVPRDPAETETGLAATPAANTGAGSWAEEVGAAAEEKPKAENDGFEQVRRERGRGGRGPRGGRGDFRGRGRGGGRGGDGHRGRGGQGRGRGAPRGEKS